MTGRWRVAAAQREEQRADLLAGVSVRIGQEHETRRAYQRLARGAYAEAARRTPQPKDRP